MTTRSPKTLNARLLSMRSMNGTASLHVFAFPDGGKRERFLGRIVTTLKTGQPRVGEVEQWYDGAKAPTMNAAIDSALKVWEAKNPNAAIDAMLKRWEGGAKEK